MAGMPVGPLSLNDEVAIDLAWKILQATKKDLGANAVDPAQEKLLKAHGGREQRFGRKNGKGFYDYPAQRAEERCGRASARSPASGSIPIRSRCRTSRTASCSRSALEAARCMEEGVVTDPREADVGSILGFGFAPFTGGAISLIDGIGAKAFVARAEELGGQIRLALRAERGPEGDGGERGESFYKKYAPAKAA